MTTKDAIKEEVDAYLALNGETGGWGESMRDSIGVDIICEQLEEGHNIKEISEIRQQVEKLLIK